MINIRLMASLPVALLLLCGNWSPAQASGDTPITVKDGGSILLVAGGLDAGGTWKISPAELRHLMSNGTLASVKITEAGADRCAGDAMCGINTSQKWTIQVNYGAVTLTLQSTSANQGVRIKFPKNARFDKWQKTANADEREFGHGDGGHISGVTVNNGANLCAGKDGCQVTLVYRVP